MADPNATVIDPGSPAPVAARRGGGAAKLSVTRGPKAGSEFVLGPGETSIGRQADNTIVIPDISVSRKHVVIRKQGLTFILVDEGSGNGTSLNGVKVESEVELSDGDVIAMGDTEVTFLAARAAPAPRVPAPHRPGPARSQRRDEPIDEPRLEEQTSEVAVGSKGSKKGRKPVLIVAVVVVLLLAGMAILKKKQEEATRLARARSEQAQVEQIIEEAKTHYEAGKKAIAAGDFKAAVGELKQAIEGYEQIEGEERAMLDLKRRLDYATKEIQNQETVEAARASGDKGELSNAMAKLNTIPEDSYYKDKVDEIVAGLKAKIPERLAAGRAALDQKDKDCAAAQEAVAEAVAVDPKNAEAESLSQAIEKKCAAKAPQGGKRTEAAPPQEDPTARIASLFLAGKIDEAVGTALACDEPRCKALKEKLTSFRDAYNNLDAPGNVDKALSILRTFSGGTSSPYMQKIAGKSSVFVNEGVKSMTADNLPKAFAAFQQALAIDPTNEVATRNMGIIHGKAKNLSEQAYIDMSQDPDKARRELELILQITAADDELHQKAKKRLRKLSGGGAD